MTWQHDAMMIYTMIIYAMVTGFNHDLMKWWLDAMMTWCNDD